MTKRHIIKGFMMLTALVLLPGCGKKDGADSSSNPDIPNKLPDTLKIKRFSKDYVITGIGIRGTKTVAIINDNVVVPGTELDPGVLLKSVDETYATVLFDNMEYKIRPESIQEQLSKKQDK